MWIFDANIVCHAALDFSHKIFFFLGHAPKRWERERGRWGREINYRQNVVNANFFYVHNISCIQLLSRFQPTTHINSGAILTSHFIKFNWIMNIMCWGWCWSLNEGKNSSSPLFAAHEFMEFFACSLCVRHSRRISRTKDHIGVWQGVRRLGKFYY